MRRKLGDLGALAVAVLADDEDAESFFDDVHADHLVTGAQADTAHAAGHAAHRAGVLLVEADGLALAVLITTSLSPLVMRIHLSSSPSSRLMAIRPLWRTFLYCSNGVFLTMPRMVHMIRFCALSVLETLMTAADGFFGLQLQQIDDSDALGVQAGSRNFVGLHAEDPALVGKEQQEVVRDGIYNVFDDVFFARSHAAATLAAPPCFLYSAIGLRLM